jgi:hypothetical protein
MTVTRAHLSILASTLSLLTLQACTTEALYEGFKQSAENHCRKQPPGESQKCLDELNKKPYSEYEKERTAQKP